MFNLSGSELVFLIVIALVVLGPDKLPDAMRRAGKAYADFKKLTTGFQNEMKSVLDEPMREFRETADLAKQAASFDLNPTIKPVTAPMAPAQPKPVVTEPAVAVEPDPVAVEPDAVTVEPDPIVEPDPSPEPAPTSTHTDVGTDDEEVTSG